MQAVHRRIQTAQQARQEGVAQVLSVRPPLALALPVAGEEKGAAVGVGWDASGAAIASEQGSSRPAHALALAYPLAAPELVFVVVVIVAAASPPYA